MRARRKSGSYFSHDYKCMGILTADTKIRIKAPRRELTGNTRIRLSQIVDLKNWIKDQRGVKANEGDYSPDRKSRKQGKKWVPANEYQASVKANDDLTVTSKTEPKGIQSKMNRRKTYSIERLKDANTGMPKGYGLKDAPVADYELKYSNGETGKAYFEVAEIDKFLRPRAIEYFNKLTPEETGVLSFYTYEGDRFMNGALRGTRPMTPKVKECIETMDRVFKNAPELGENLVTFRYGSPLELGNLLNDKELSKYTEVQSPSRKDIKRLIENHIGDEYTNPAYVSTNVDQEKINMNGVVFRIKNRKQQKALYISPLADNSFSFSDIDSVMKNSENELLINRGQKFKVCDVQTEGTRNRIVVDLEVL